MRALDPQRIGYPEILELRLFPGSSPIKKEFVKNFKAEMD
jgi:hypothetical protein